MRIGLVMQRVCEIDHPTRGRTMDRPGITNSNMRLIEQHHMPQNITGSLCHTAHTLRIRECCPGSRQGQRSCSIEGCDLHHLKDVGGNTVQAKECRHETA